MVFARREGPDVRKPRTVVDFSTFCTEFALRNAPGVFRRPPESRRIQVPKKVHFGEKSDVLLGAFGAPLGSVGAPFGSKWALGGPLGLLRGTLGPQLEAQGRPKGGPGGPKRRFGNLLKT